MQKYDVHVIAGPTASGKSAHALSLAHQLDGVIINADSLQLYNGLPILTAQPTADDKAFIPHTLYACFPPETSINAMDWRKFALHEIDKVIAAQKTPIIVGGTGFYLKTLMQGLSPIPEIPNEVRILSEDLMDSLGIEEFFLQLTKLDPVLCDKIDRHNRQRLVRAYEVIAHTGKPMSYWQSLPSVGIPDHLHFIPHLIMPERDILYDRCNQRFDIMVDMGVVDEVRQFDDRMMAGKIPFDCALTHALGFQSLQAHVRGEMDLETAITLSKNETRHYAKRQATWFKHQM